MILSLYDLTGIQPYIFGGNRLQENIGASWLAKQALGDWLGHAATGPARLSWSGGGNAMVLCPTLADAQGLATRLSLRLHDEAPGLGLACAHVEWDGNGASFRERLDAAHASLRAAKDGRIPAARWDGAGVIAACAVTGEPAVDWDGERWIGAADRAKQDAFAQAEAALQGLVPQMQERPDLGWTRDIDKLGRTKSERSFVGILHFDGNAMGERFKATRAECDLAALSHAVNEAGRATVRSALGWVLSNLDGITDVEAGGFELIHDAAREVSCLPVRPIVYGGDDVTLVCDARIALDLAAKLLEAWHESTNALPGGAAHACVGVALVKSHHPFYRGYRLAEELCRGAKRWVREAGVDASALDWELLAGGGTASLGERRRRSGRAEDGHALHSRPYVVVGNVPHTQPYRRWAWLRRDLLGRLQSDEDSHTQYKSLATVMKEGRLASRTVLDRWRDRFEMRLPEPTGLALATDGFANGETPYLDALELMDMILPAECFPKGGVGLVAREGPAQ